MRKPAGKSAAVSCRADPLAHPERMRCPPRRPSLPGTGRSATGSFSRWNPRNVTMSVKRQVAVQFDVNCSRSSEGVTPNRRLKARRMFSSEPKPNCVATTLRDTVWSSSASRAASTRTCSTYCAGDFSDLRPEDAGKVALGHVAARRHRRHRIGVSGPFLDGGQQGVEPAGRAVELVAQAGAELALPALPLDRQNQRSRDAERFGAAKVFLDKCKCHVDARGDAGGCPDGTILDENLVTRHRDAGIFLRKAMGIRSSASWHAFRPGVLPRPG